MGSFLTILPLAIVMIAGPQIISAVFLATSEGWARNSLAYVAGAAVSITVVVTAAYLFFRGAKGTPSAESGGSEGRIIDGIIILLLLFAAFHVFHTRHESEPPKWMGRLQAASAGFSFKLGLLLLGVFPTDIVTAVSAGAKVAREGDAYWHVLPFIALTLLLVALPSLLVVVLGARARVLLPKVRDWMNANAWMVSEAVILLFVGIEVSSFLGS